MQTIVRGPYNIFVRPALGMSREYGMWRELGFVNIDELSFMLKHVVAEPSDEGLIKSLDRMWKHKKSQ